jgi:hypothetical protein
MGKAATAPKDIFMQFAAVVVGFDGADTTNLVSASLATGLSLRAGLIWLIHKIEWEVGLNICTANAGFRGALSVRAGLTVIPQRHQDGVLDALAHHGSCGGGLQQYEHAFFPPIPLAAASINIYARTSANVAQAVDDETAVRIGFTTAPLDAQTYQEIAETWGYVG